MDKLTHTILTYIKRELMDRFREKGIAFNCNARGTPDKLFGRIPALQLPKTHPGTWEISTNYTFTNIEVALILKWHSLYLIDAHTVELTDPTCIRSLADLFIHRIQNPMLRFSETWHNK